MIAKNSESWRRDGLCYTPVHASLVYLWRLAPRREGAHKELAAVCGVPIAVILIPR